MKRIAHAFVMLAGLAVSATSLAQVQILGPSPSSRATLDLYDAPGAVQAVKQLSTSALTFPVTVREQKGGYNAIDVEGQEYWLRNAQLRVGRSAKASCDTSEKAIKTERPGHTASTPGAGADVCK